MQEFLNELDRQSLEIIKAFGIIRNPYEITYLPEKKMKVRLLDSRKKDEYGW